MSMSLSTPVTPRWLRLWSVLTVLAALPLVSLGAVVTTKQFGMADSVPFREPWHLFVAPLQELGLAFQVEHSHRLAGWIVGFCAVVLAGGLWLCEPRRWLCWLGTAAMLGVGIQGLLGGFRVQLNAILGPDLALVHGVVGQLVFALLVALALCTSRRWAAEAGEAQLAPAGLRRGTLLLVGLLVLQLIAGAFLRHKGASWSQRVHVLLAFAVVAVAAWLIRYLWHPDQAAGRVFEPRGSLRRTAIILMGLLVFQLMLGVESWVFRFTTDPYAPQAQFWGRDLVRSLHVFVGALVLAAGVALALQCNAAGGLAPVKPQAVDSPTLEGAA